MGVLFTYMNISICETVCRIHSECLHASMEVKLDTSCWKITSGNVWWYL